MEESKLNNTSLHLVDDSARSAGSSSWGGAIGKQDQD